jgi:RNA polymerase sigma-70 factor (sigma-E family)
MGTAVSNLGGWAVLPERPVFDDFYRCEWPGAVRLAHLLTGVDAVAEDLAQEAFTRVHRQWSTVENGPAYLRTTIVNVCRTWHRSRGREETRTRRAWSPDDAAPLGNDELLDAIDALPYRQKAVLVLRYYHDLPESEIAKALDCRPGTVKSLASRGLAQLRKVIEP